MKKIRGQYVLVTIRDYNTGKDKFVVCENMEIAKREFSSDTPKRFVTVLVED